MCELLDFKNWCSAGKSTGVITGKIVNTSAPAKADCQRDFTPIFSVIFLELSALGSRLVSAPPIVIVCPLGRSTDQRVVSSDGRAGDS